MSWQKIRYYNPISRYKKMERLKEKLGCGCNNCSRKTKEERKKERYQFNKE